MVHVLLRRKFRKRIMSGYTLRTLTYWVGPGYGAIVHLTKRYNGGNL